MAFNPITKQAGDVARAEEWNEVGAEVVRLENDKVDKAGDTLTGPLTIGNLKIGDWPANPNNYVVFGTDNLDQVNAGNYALLQQAYNGRTYLNSPINIRFRTNNIDRMILTNGGELGIGLTDPQARLHIAYNSDVTPMGGGTVIIGDVNGDNIAMDSNEIMARDNGSTALLHIQREGGDLWINNSTGLVVKDSKDVGIGTSSPQHKLDVRGNIGNNTTLHHSDIRWKKNIASLSKSLSKVMQLRGVAFEWRHDEYAEMNFPNGQQIGLIAQEVEKVVPEVVSTNDDGYQSVAYTKLVPLLIEAVKDLQTEVAQLKVELENLQSVPENGRQLLPMTE